MEDLPDLGELRAFVAVCEHGGFGRAAERLGLSQPAVSRRIAKLEATLGARLFEEPRRRVIPTAAGHELRRFCTRFLRELERLGTRSRDAGWPSDEPLRIACAGAFGRFVVFPILAGDDFGGQPVHLLFRRPEQVYELVDSGVCEIGFTYETRTTRRLDLVEAFVERFVLVGPAEQPTPEPWGLTAVAERPFVTYEECDYVFGKWFADVFGTQPRRLRSASHFERLEEVLAMVARGRGVSIVPEHAVHGVETRGVRILDPDGRPSLNTEYAVTRPGRARRPAVERLLEHLRVGSELEPGAGTP